MKKFRGYYKKPNPETVKKWVENNKKLYGKEIKSLKEIITYNSKIKKKDNFTSDMLIALLSGRKITPKMEDAINNIIKRNDPKYRAERLDWLETILPKINLLKAMLEKTSWKSSYKSNTLYFIESVEDQAKNRLSLTKKQSEALNRLYKKISNHLEKNA